MTVIDPFIVKEYDANVKVKIGDARGEVNLDNFVPGALFTVTFKASPNDSVSGGYSKTTDNFRIAPIGGAPLYKPGTGIKPNADRHICYDQVYL